MRDDQISAMHTANYRRIELLLRQFEFVQTRQVAYEETLNTTWKRIKAIFAPDWAKRMVDNRQLELLAKCKEEMRKAQMTPKLVAVTNGQG